MIRYKAKPLFIFGCYRSGTSLLRLVLDAHPEIYIPEETVFIPRFFRQIKKYEKNWDMGGRDRLIKDILVFLKRKAHWESVPVIKEVTSLIGPSAKYQDVVRAIIIAASNSKFKKISYWGDKTPQYINSVLLLNRLFPDAMFINMVRDGRDVLASVKKEIAWGGHTPLMVAEEWNKRVLNGLLGEKLIGRKRFLTVRYESFVSSPESILRELIDFLGLGLSESMLEYYKLPAAKALSRFRHQRNVATPISTRSVGQYKQILSDDEISAFEREAGNALIAMGYATSEFTVTGTDPSDKLKDYIIRTYRGVRYRVLDKMIK